MRGNFMNKKNWLIAGLSLAMVASLGVGISACGEKNPDTPEHTHEYTEWEHSDTQHWMVCPDDGDIWAQGKQAHDFSSGDCVCGAKKPGEGGDETPDADLDTREFWATGSGAGDLQNSSWTELKPNFKLKKEPHKDAEGFTLYTIQFKIYAGGDKFKIRQDERDENNALVWTDGTFFGLNEIRGNDGTFVDMGTQDIGVAKGKDGVYKFTVHTKPAPAPWADNYVSWELVEPVAAPTTTEDMYIVGTLAKYPKSQWPDYTNVKNNCIHMTFDGTDTWYAEVELSKNDQFKVFNILNKQYFPSTANLTCSEEWLYRVSWTVGQDNVKVEHVHKYTAQAYDGENHWMKCPKDDAKDESTVEAHDFSQGDTCKCGFQQEADPDWKINEDGTLNEYTGDFVNMTIPANLTTFPQLAYIFGLSANNKYAFDHFEKSNWAKVKSLKVDPKSTSFKIENNALVSYDGTILYLYLPYSTETSATFENVTEIKGGAFSYNSKIQSASFPKLVKVSNYAFYDTTALATISMPKVEELGSSVFYNTQIETVELKSVKTIEGYLFTNCQQLTTLVLGDKLESIGRSFCSNCLQLTTVTVKAVTPPTGSSFFSRCTGLTHIYVPEGSVDAYKAASGWSAQADKISAITEAVSVAPVEVAMLPGKED